MSPHPIEQQISECLICQKPLGQDSKDLDWRVCKDHRVCTSCGKPILREDVRNAHDTVLDLVKLEHNSEESISSLMLKYLQHSRCQLSDSDLRKNGEQDPSVTVQQSYLDWLNNFRLLCQPQMDLSQQTNEKQADVACEPILIRMSLEEKFIFLARLESAVAHVSIAIKTDHKQIKQRLDKQEAKKFQDATKQAQVSGRPASKPETDETEVLIAEFAKKNELTDVVARKLWKERNKSIQGLVKSGFPEKAAADMVDGMLRSQGRIK